MKHLMRTLYLAIAMLVLVPSVSLAEKYEPQVEIVDARLEGYEPNANMKEPGTTSLTWLLFVFLSVVGLGVLFKDAKRTHLD